MAVGPQVTPHQPQLGPIADALDVIDVSRGLAASGHAACRVDTEKLSSEALPVRVIATLTCVRAGGIVCPLPLVGALPLAWAGLAGSNAKAAAANSGRA